MKEELDVYDLKGNFLGFEEREEFYEKSEKEFSIKGKCSRQVKSVAVLLMNSNGRIYLQKRSDLKKHNPGLYDKTVGGHVTKNNSFNMTLVKECAEELGFPTSVFNPEEFDKAIKAIDLSVMGIFRKIDQVLNFQSVRQHGEAKEYIQPYWQAAYVGYYDGSIKFVDGESSGIEVFSLDKLKQEINKNPNKFTEDIKLIISKYEKYLVPIKK